MPSIGNGRGSESVPGQALAGNDFPTLGIEAGKGPSIVATVEPVLDQYGSLHVIAATMMDPGNGVVRLLDIRRRNISCSG